MLHPKSFTKTRHEHHIYVLVHVMECIDEALQLKRSIKVLNKKLLHNSYSNKWGCKPIFIEQKYYRIYMWHLNKVWNMNFVDNNEIIAVEK